VVSGLRSHGAFFTRGSATKNGKGMPGRVESQLGAESGERRHRKGLKCRGGAAAAQPTAAAAPPPAPAPTAAPATPAPAPTAVAPPARPAPPASTAVRPAPSTPTGPVGANQFSTEAQAKARCPSDTVVWVNLTSKIYHFSGTKHYGTTKHGANGSSHRGRSSPSTAPWRRRRQPPVWRCRSVSLMSPSARYTPRSTG
jgi:hypothetical protein